jgi:hypothetical protein
MTHHIHTLHDTSYSHFPQVASGHRQFSQVETHSVIAAHEQHRRGVVWPSQSRLSSNFVRKLHLVTKAVAVYEVQGGREGPSSDVTLANNPPTIANTPRGNLQVCTCARCSMGWLWLVGSTKLYVSFAKEPYKRDDILQKRPIILSILLTVATPYVCAMHSI